MFGAAPKSNWPKINKDSDGRVVAAYYWKVGEAASLSRFQHFNRPMLFGTPPQLSAVEPKRFRQQREYTTYVKSDSMELCPVFVSRVAMGNTVGSFKRPVVPTGAGRLMHKFCIIGPDNLFRQAQVSVGGVGQ